MTRRSNLILGAVVLAATAALLFIWIPLDIDTGIVEKQRRRMVIGDSFAPMIAGVFLALGALGLLLPERNAPNQPALHRQNLRFIASVLAILVVSLTLMRTVGPLAVALYNDVADSQLQYRLLRDSPPWKFLGFIVGGTTLISGLIMLVQGKFSWRSIVIAALAVLLMIAVYDLPFDDLLLPPNGDV